MTPISCGIDFGTSNTSAAIARDGHATLVPLENNQVTIPSAIFYLPGSQGALFGREAVKSFLERKEGRFMRSLKRVLGTSLMKHGTTINGKPVKFERIISLFLQNIKQKTTQAAGHEVDHVVMGRPVHFVDNDSAADKRAQEELRTIVQHIGFKHVEFQFEPIAAAFAHEINIKEERLAIVADLGGGTSDFTVIRVSSKYVNKQDRSSDILANTGVRVGGNDFDKDLALAVIMPELGYRSTYGKKHLEVPLKYYHDLAEWSKVNFLYTPKVLMQVNQYLNESHDKKRFGRLVKLIEREQGHTLLATAEETKIALTEQAVHEAEFPFVDDDLALSITRRQFEEAIQQEVHKISAAATDCLQKAGVKQKDIDLVILTGGSTELPIIQQAFKNLFPQASVADENKLSSVGLGLAYDSARRFH